jgi:hypothetical protein
MAISKLSDIVTTTDPETGIRSYIDKNSLETQYKSVTTIIGKFEDKEFLKVWRNQVGEDAAKEIMQNSASLGTRVHKANELYFTSPSDKYLSYTHDLDTQTYTRHRCYLPLLANLTVLGHYDTPLLEQKLITEVVIEGSKYGFGGTPDLVGTMAIDRACKLFYPNWHLKNTIDESFFNKHDLERKQITFVADYKNWRGNSKGSSDLLKTFLQLSAYMILVNQFVDDPFKVRHGFIFGTTGDNKLAIYYLNFTKMCWYAQWFLYFCKAFYDDTPMSWSDFKYESFKDNKYKPVRLYVKGVNMGEDEDPDSTESSA